jgi:hypothetical protein
MKKYYIIFLIVILYSVAYSANLPLYNSYLTLLKKKYNSKVLYKVTNISKNECFEKIIYIIKFFKAKIIKMNLQKGYIIAYKFNNKFNCCLKTTEVIFLFKELQSFNTIIVITSNNGLLASLVHTQLCTFFTTI